MFFLFFFNHPPTTDIYTLSLHDALPICSSCGTAPGGRAGGRYPPTARGRSRGSRGRRAPPRPWARSEEHTSELQSHHDLVCRLLLEKKKKINNKCMTEITR